jgi:hypothetical protein
MWLIAFQAQVNDWGFTFALYSAHRPSLTARPGSCGRTFASGFFTVSPRGSDLAFDYGWRHCPRREPFIPIEPATVST